MIARWTFQNLRDAPLSVLGSASAVAAVFTLVILFEGIWLGEAGQVVAYAEHTDADVWVMQHGVSNMRMATSLLSTDRRARVSAVAGVENVAPILYSSSIVEAGDRKSMSYVVGLYQGGQRGGPWAIAEGALQVEPGEAIIPNVLASLSGVSIGDLVSIADRKLTVVGLSQGTYSMANPVTFVHARDVAELLSTYDYDSYLLVKTAAGGSPADVAQRIENQVSGTSALTRTEFIESDRGMALQMGVEIIGLITAIGTALSVVLVAFALYTHTARRRRELAILAALGFRRIPSPSVPSSVARFHRIHRRPWAKRPPHRRRIPRFTPFFSSSRTMTNRAVAVSSAVGYAARTVSVSPGVVPRWGR
jgi:ABC-type antimicrobial peptide transport system permease subunit